VATSLPIHFELSLPPLRLEAGGEVARHVVRGFAWGPTGDAERIARIATPIDPQPWRVVRRTAAELDRAPSQRASGDLRDDVPTVLLVHALTGDARPGGPGGWWEPLVGPGAPLDPAKVRLVCFNLLGSCYGTSGPCDEGFPVRDDDPRLPATVTTWDQAASILLALDALGIENVELVIGGSLGGMVALCLAALAPDRFARVAPLCATDAASPWIIAFNHVARQTVLADPSWPEDASRGLELARQLAMITYRTERGFDLTQGRRLVGADEREAPDWSAPQPYRMQTYLEHQGAKLRARFDARSYLCLLGAMDHHDLARAPRPFAAAPAGESWGLSRIRASALGIDVDTDQLYLPAQTDRWTAALFARGLPVERVTVRSPHGHDAFLIEWDQLRPMVARALTLPLARGAHAATTPTSSSTHPESSQ